jgi:alpha-tubulin suppressor-like RCC1 family protein
MVGIKNDNTLWTWGYGNCGGLGDGVGGNNRSSPDTTVGGGTTWCQASAKYFSTAAIKTDGTLWTWGGNTFGQLGQGDTAHKSSPATVAGGGTNWCQTSMSCLHSGAVKTNGTLWTWGANSKCTDFGTQTTGLLGSGQSTFASRSSPGTTAGGGTNWCFVSMGGSSGAGIKTDGTLWTWGPNYCGELGIGILSGACRSSPVSVVGGITVWHKVNFAAAKDRCQFGPCRTDHVAALTKVTFGFNSV